METRAHPRIHCASERVEAGSSCSIDPRRGGSTRDECLCFDGRRLEATDELRGPTVGQHARRTGRNAIPAERPNTGSGPGWPGPASSFPRAFGVGSGRQRSTRGLASDDSIYSRDARAAGHEENVRHRRFECTRCGVEPSIGKPIRHRPSCVRQVTGQQYPKHSSEMLANAVLKALTAKGWTRRAWRRWRWGARIRLRTTRPKRVGRKNRSVAFKILLLSEFSH